MKRFLIILGILFPMALAAQETAPVSPDEYARRYNNLIERVGPAGVGVETLLDKWEAAYPQDIQMLTARFAFYFTRCRKTTVIQLEQDRYLGEAPILPMTDSLGRKCNFFEVWEYDDDLFAQAIKAIDKVIAAQARRLDYRFNKIDALMGYEKENPDMTLQELKALADRENTQHPVWEYPGMDGVNRDQFKAFMQDYCAALFRIGSPQSAEAFKNLSEYLLKYYKDDPLFLDNLGSYYLVKKDFKQATKYFEQVLKKHPDDQTALHNCLILAKVKKDVKLEKKYLALMAKYGETEIDRASAQARLDALQ